MLSFNVLRSRTLRLALAVIVAPVALTLQGCQVRPLYATIGTDEVLKSISFSPAENRVGQELRNDLIFLLAGGAGEPQAPEYDVDLVVKQRNVDVVVDQYNDLPRAGRIVLVADFTLKKHKTGEVIKSGSRSSVALVDYSRQEFAKLRAVRDAENRAAKELSELIRADLAGWLGR